MRSLRRLYARLTHSISRSRNDERLREEMELHLTAQTEENLRAGMTDEEARRQARLKFGAVEVIREQYHAQAGLPFADILLLDMRYALRAQRKSPVFTVVAMITLMLGIGANVVVFGVLNAVLLRPLEVRDPQSLYQLRHKPWTSFRLLTTSYPAFEDFRRRNRTFSELAAINAYARAGLLLGNTTLSVAGDWVSGNYFDLLGVQPEVGRFFHTADEHGPASAPYVVLSDALWRKAFHADRGVAGTTVEFNQHPYTVVGVAPAKFHGTEKFVWPDYWMPMMNVDADGADTLHERGNVSVTVIGRIRPGVTPQQATEDLNGISAELAKEYPKTDDGQALRLIHPGLFADEGDLIRQSLWSVTVLALLVLFAACANLASLFAARAADRSQEMALRVALGSSRARLLRQLLTEAMMVSLLGGAAGLAGAGLLLAVLNRWNSPYGHLAVGVDGRVFVAGLAFTLGSAVLFGMVPARQLLQSSPLQGLKSAHCLPLHSLPLGRFALRDLLLGVQIAICTLLVTAALVAVRGMVGMLHAPLGFRPQGAMLVDVDLNPPGVATDTGLKRKEIIEAAQSIPGVTAAGAVSRTPMTGGMRGVPIFPPGTIEFTLKNSVLSPYVFPMSPGYLAAAGTRLLGGRDFGWQDTAKTPYVAIVNQTFARAMWAGRPAMGQRFVLWGHLFEVVGVAENGKYHDLQESPQPVAYVPFAQAESDEGEFVVRSQRPPNEMAAALQHMLSGVDANVSVTVLSWTDALEGELFGAQAACFSLGVMGMLAAMLATTGIFAMAAYNVSRRKKELGVRMALGARRVEVMRAAVGRPMLLLGVGSVVGLVAGILASRLLGHIVYRADPQDPLAVAGAVATMALLGVIAAAIPAHRALTVDPSQLMREE